MKIGLKTYLTIVVASVSSLPIIVFLLWPYSSIYNERMDEVEERHLLMAQTIATSLEHYRDELIAAMDTFVMKLDEGRALAAGPIMENLNFYHVCVVRKSDGVVVSSYLGNELPCTPQLSERGLAFATANIVEGEITFGGLGFRKGPSRIFVYADLGDHFVQGAVPTKVFKDLQSNIKFGEEGHAVIVDPNGRVIAHSLPEWEEGRKNLSELPIVQAMMQGESGVMPFFSSRVEEELIGGYTSVAVAGWGIMVAQPLWEFSKAAAMFNREIFLILFSGLLASLLIAFFVAHSFEKRIKGIQNVVSDIANGAHDFDFEDQSRGLDITEFRSMETGISTIVRKIAASEDRYRNLFDNVPVASREEDLSAMKRRVDALDLPNVQALETYLDENPEFIIECGKTIKVVDANAAALTLHAAHDVVDINENSLSEFKPESILFLSEAIIAIFKGETRGIRETTITSLTGDVRSVISTWCILPGYEADYSRSLMTSIDVTEKVETEKALRHAQKMEAVGQLTGGIAHDFNNLLAVIGGSAYLLDLNAEHDADLIDLIKNAVERGAELTQRLLAFSSKQTLQPQAIDVLEMACEIREILRRTLGPNIEIQINANQETLFVRADRGQIEAALLNLAINARDAMPNGGVLTLEFEPAELTELEALDLEPGKYIVCSVADNGAGMSEETLNHAFEPFFTTKSVGKGSGLGLSMVYGFARQSSGAAKIESSLGDGTVVKLFLPQAVSAPVIKQSEDKSSCKAQTDSLNILVLEDNPEVLALLSRMLHTLGHTTLLAPTIDAAWEFVNEGGQIDLLLSDVLLSGPQKGTDFADELRLQKPECPIIFTSGYPNIDLVDSSDNKTEWMAKPFSSQALAAIIERLCPLEILNHRYRESSR